MLWHSEKTVEGSHSCVPSLPLSAEESVRRERERERERRREREREREGEGERGRGERAKETRRGGRSERAGMVRNAK